MANIKKRFPENVTGEFFVTLAASIARPISSLHRRHLTMRGIMPLCAHSHTQCSSGPKPCAPCWPARRDRLACYIKTTLANSCSISRCLSKTECITPGSIRRSPMAAIATWSCSSACEWPGRGGQRHPSRFMCFSSSCRAQASRHQHRCQQHAGGSDPGRQFIAIPPDQGSDQPRSHHHRPID
jgi:hypothetical protein